DMGFHVHTRSPSNPSLENLPAMANSNAEAANASFTIISDRRDDSVNATEAVSVKWYRRYALSGFSSS
ncbi:MAG: hypothetical protein L6R39_006392, partial [Caloplaca ligustica]